MKYAIKDAAGNIYLMQVLDSVPPLLDGMELVGPHSEEFDSYCVDCLIEAAGEVIVSLDKVRAKKLKEIRAQRDILLKDNDTAWLIAKKKLQDTAALETEAQSLRDLPEVAETALADLMTVEDIKAYDAFAVQA